DECVAIAPKLADVLHHAVAAALDALAVHVAREGDKSPLREAPRSTPCVIVETGAAVNDEDSRAAARQRRVPGKHAIERLAAVAIPEIVGLDHEVSPLSGVL